MKTTLEKINLFDVLYVGNIYTWGEACMLPVKAWGEGGIDDWVLPDRFTLTALAILADGQVHGLHWSSSLQNVEFGWCVCLYDGYVYSKSCGNLRLVRLVRASQCLGICTAAAKKSMDCAGIGTESTGESK